MIVFNFTCAYAQCSVSRSVWEAVKEPEIEFRNAVTCLTTLGLLDCEAIERYEFRSREQQRWQFQQRKKRSSCPNENRSTKALLN